MESDLESESIFSGRSRSQSWSRLLFVDSVALVAGCQPSADNDIGRTFMHRPVNIEKHKEKEIGSIQIKLKRHLLIKFRLIEGFGGRFGVIAIIV